MIMGLRHRLPVSTGPPEVPGRTLRGERRGYEEAKSEIDHEDDGNSPPARADSIHMDKLGCCPDPAMDPTRADEANVSASTVASMATAGADEANARTSTVAPMATAGAFASDVSKIGYRRHLGPWLALNSEERLVRTGSWLKRCRTAWMPRVVAW